MTVFEAVGRGSIPRRGTESIVLGVCRIQTRAREARRPGSIPGENTLLLQTLIPTVGRLPAMQPQVGSTPTGVPLNGRSLMLR